MLRDLAKLSEMLRDPVADLRGGRCSLRHGRESGTIQLSHTVELCTQPLPPGAAEAILFLSSKRRGMRYENVCIEGLGYVIPDHVVTSDWIEQQLAPV